MDLDEQTRQTIARAIRERRASLGLSQEEAARASGGMISTANLRVFEGAGRASFRDKSLIGVARAMRWPADAVAQIAAGADWRSLGSVAGDVDPVRSGPTAGSVELATADRVASLEREVASQRLAIAELGRQLGDLIAELGTTAPRWSSDLLTAAHSGTDADLDGPRRASRTRVESFEPDA